MFREEDVSFPADGGIELSAWLFVPDADGPLPAITMAHGYAGTKYHTIEPLAEHFAQAGFAVLLHDHRGFGDSRGEPRQHVNPWQQIADWRRAISYLEDRPEVDESRVGLWAPASPGPRDRARSDRPSPEGGGRAGPDDRRPCRGTPPRCARRHGGTRGEPRRRRARPAARHTTVNAADRERRGRAGVRLRFGGSGQLLAATGARRRLGERGYAALHAVGAPGEAACRQRSRSRSPLPVFPGEIFQAPRSWAEKVYPNLRLHPRGRRGRALRSLGGATGLRGGDPRAFWTLR
jgi:fermentation-respiration switch protein FrsA (DUF1100 family)